MGGGHSRRRKKSSAASDTGVWRIKSAPVFRKHFRKPSANISSLNCSLEDMNSLTEVWYQHIFPHKTFFAESLRRAVNRNFELADALHLPTSDSAAEFRIQEIGNKIKRHFVQIIDSLTQTEHSGQPSPQFMENLNRKLGSKYSFLAGDQFQTAFWDTYAVCTLELLCEDKSVTNEQKWEWQRFLQLSITQMKHGYQRL